MLNVQEYTVISFNVTGEFNTYRCKKRVKDIIQSVARIMGINPKSLEILKPKDIPEGQRIEINCYMNNNQFIVQGLEQILSECVCSGQLLTVVSSSWRIDNYMLNVSNLKCKHIQSNETVILRMEQAMEADIDMEMVEKYQHIDKPVDEFITPDCEYSLSNSANGPGEGVPKNTTS